MRLLLVMMQIAALKALGWQNLKHYWRQLQAEVSFLEGFTGTAKVVQRRYLSNSYSGTRVFIFCTLVNGTTILGTSFIFSIRFHLSHPRTSLDILKDWIDLIDDDGWVAREQILGEEARSKVKSSSPISVLLKHFWTRFHPNFTLKYPTTQIRPP